MAPAGCPVVVYFITTSSGSTAQGPHRELVIRAYDEQCISLPIIKIKNILFKNKKRRGRMMQ